MKLDNLIILMHKPFFASRTTRKYLAIEELYRKTTKIIAVKNQRFFCGTCIISVDVDFSFKPKFTISKESRCFLSIKTNLNT